MPAPVRLISTSPGRRPVLAFHCSAGAPRQWRALSEALGPGFEVIAPNLIGSSPETAWPGERPFTFRDELEPALARLDGLDGPVHLVGHSYGGAVALGVALARPSRVASLALYEPLPMHLLLAMGPQGRAAVAELREIAAGVRESYLAGDYVEGMRSFIDYWGGRGAWRQLGPGAAAAAVAYLPKIGLDFRAALGVRTPLQAYRRISAPALVLDGARTRGPASILARALVKVLRSAAAQTLDEAGHMGPVTHPQDVAQMFSAHIRTHAGVAPPQQAMSEAA